MRADYPPKYRIAAEQNKPDRFPIACKELLLRNHPLTSAGNRPPEHHQEWKIQPDNICRPSPDNVAHLAVVAIDDPMLALYDRSHRCSKFIDRQRSPTGLPVDRVEFKMRNVARSGNPTGKRRLA